jgi:glycine/D-amino acid oxidase-like deaminating enzyme
MTQNNYDVIIVGGGIMGSSTAYYLTKSDDKLKVAVVERDPTYTQASTTLSMANVRIQFSLKENIQISQYAFNVLENFEEEMAVNEERPNISYRREGNLFLVNETGYNATIEVLKRQKNLGCDVEWWSTEKIKEKYPLYKPTDLKGGTFGPQDGHIDAYAVLMGYKTKARSQGAEYIEDEVVKLVTDGNKISGVKLASDKQLNSGYVVNCAGAWAADLAKSIDIELPINPVKRQVFVLDTEVKPKKTLPLTILPSGLYFRSETGNLILLGKSMVDDPIGFDFSWEQERFTDYLWEELVMFIPFFDRLKLLRGWAGLYAENTFDGNAILGEWPEYKGFYLANGFSGHGLQQAPAVGRYISELVIGQTPTLDMSIFRPERILENRPLREDGLV